MKNLILLALVLSSSISFAQKTDKSDEAALEARLEKLRLAMITPDKATLEELAADNLVYAHSAGYVETKAQFVDALVSGKSDFTAVTISNQEITFSGNTAIVRNKLLGETLNNNVPGKVDVTVMQVWQKQNGVWKLLGRQAARIPAEASK